jgi:hypothetical protein
MILSSFLVATKHAKSLTTNAKAQRNQNDLWNISHKIANQMQILSVILSLGSHLFQVIRHWHIFCAGFISAGNWYPPFAHAGRKVKPISCEYNIYFL